MRGDDAARRHVTSIADLTAIAPQLRFATDIEFLERPEWVAVKRAYGLEFKSAHPYQPTFMFRALTDGTADVIPAFSSDGRIAADKLTVLADPKGAIPGYDAILMVSPRRAHDDRFLRAIRPLVGHIPVEAMREANYMVDRDDNKASPEAAARWLEKKLGL
jgi:osmoprotectant transport system permease protein